MSMSRLLSWYSSKLDTHPLLTKAASSGLIAAGGDFICQTTIDKKEWNRVRTMRFFALGAGLVAPATHFWYNALALRFPGTSTRAVIQRLGLDQFVFAPLFTSVWLTSLWTLEGNTDDMASRLLHIVPGVVVANWFLWIPGMALNFRFVPTKFQVLFGNGLGFLWNVYLSYKTAHEAH